MSGLLVLGALHHDVVVDAPRLPRLDETLVGSAVDYRFGGKGGNQALAAARMGASVRMVGRVGDDAAGSTLLSVLDCAGIDRTAVLTGRQPTGMSVAITDTSGDYGAVIVSGANLENDGELPTGASPDIALIQNEIPEMANVALAAGLPEATALIWNAAPARPWNDLIGARCDLLVVNRLEAADLSGETDPEAAARVLHDRVRGSVIVTLGGDGALYTLPFILPEMRRGARGAAPLASGAALAGAEPELVHLPALSVRVVSTHGAGDMFVGALAAYLLESNDLGAAIGFAQKAAASLVAAPIADRSRISRETIQGFGA